jgi:hypothetical protein
MCKKKFKCSEIKKETIKKGRRTMELNSKD